MLQVQRLFIRKFRSETEEKKYVELQKFIVLDLIKVKLCKHQFLYILNYEERITFKCKI